ncbi:MAG TPA: PAS domain S-box protein [Polyangiaceae bacterium]|jgi:PAS domain S-box-containing protein|nr:PAS domain S-box protein [Polyangiaceae bacterium]
MAGDPPTAPPGLSAPLRDLDGDGAERKRYQQALLASEERFRRLAEASYEGVTIVENDRIVDANPQAAAMVGYTLAEYVGMPVLNLVASENRAEVADRMRLSIDQGKPWEGYALHKDGSKVLIEARSRVVRSGERVMLVSVFRDIGAQRAREERLRENEKMQVIGRLAGSVAHDFNNLLSVILGCAHLLESQLAGNESRRGLATEIVAAGERASALTRQLLSFSRRTPPDPRVLDMNAVISGMGQMLSRLLGHEVRVTMQLEARPALVRADASQLEQVIMNLCTNARDALLPAGGEIVVRTESVEGGPEGEGDGIATASGGPSPRSAGRWVHMVVSDNGSGMDAATLARAFEPLFTTKPIGRGTGLGLATVHAIVTQNGGQVTLESSASRGTHAHVWIPGLVFP